MYFAAVLLGLIISLMILIQLYLEHKARKRRIASIFKNATVFIFRGKDENGVPLTPYRYPIRSVRYTCGRRSKIGPTKNDIATPSANRTVSRRSVLFYIKDGEFHMKRLRQKWIWIADKNHGTVYLMTEKGLDVEKDLRIPKEFCPRGADGTAYIRCSDDFVLNFGDRFVIGDLLFEFNEWGAY